MTDEAKAAQTQEAEDRGGCTLANATCAPLVLNVTRPNTIAGREQFIKLPPNSGPVKVKKADYEFLKKLDIFQRLVAANALVVDGNVKNIIRATSEPQMPEELKAAVAPKGEGADGVWNVKTDQVSIAAPGVTPG